MNKGKDVSTEMLKLSERVRKEHSTTQGVEGERGGSIGTPGIRAIDLSNYDFSNPFEHIEWVEPNEYGDPVGSKGALGWSGNEVRPDGLTMAEAYIGAIESEYIMLTRRLRELVCETDSEVAEFNGNSQALDEKIDRKVRHYLAELYNHLGHLKDELDRAKREEVK